MNTSIPPELVTAYSETIIRIQLNDFETLVIHSSTNHTDTAAFQNSLGQKVGVLWVITAENPFSQLLAMEENIQRQESLLTFLTDQGLDVLHAVCGSPDGTWSENSFAVPVEHESAKETEDVIHQMARHFGQNAVFKITHSILSVISTLDGDHLDKSEALHECKYVSELSSLGRDNS